MLNRKAISSFNTFLKRGYEDPDADVLGKLGKSLGSLFGNKKVEKEKGPKEVDDAVESNKNSTTEKKEADKKKKNWFGL